MNTIRARRRTASRDILPPALILLSFPVMACSQNTRRLPSPEDFWSDPAVVALACAIDRDDVQGIDQLVKDGVDINAASKRKNGSVQMLPLAWALMQDKKPGFKRLLEHGADVSVPFEHYGSMLYALARVENDSEWLKLALEHKANPNQSPRPAIFGAIESGRNENLDLLLDAGASVDPRLESDDTPLLRAADPFNAYDMVYRLIEAGADFRARNKNGVDLAYIVVADVRVRPDQERGRWREKVIEFLVDRGITFREVEERLARDASEPSALARWRNERDARSARWGKLSPTAAADFRRRGTARIWQLDYKRAIDDFNSAIALAPDIAASYRLRADARYRAEPSGPAADENLRQANDDLTRAVEVEPRFAEAIALRARVRIALSEPRMAIEDFTAAISVDPNNATIYWQRGDARARYASSGCPKDEKPEQFGCAIADCDTSIAMVKRDPRAFRARGFVWLEQGEYDNAIADFTKAVELDPEYADALSDRATAFYRKGLATGGWTPEPPNVSALYDRAIADLNESIRLDPEIAFAFFQRATVWYQKRDYDKAIADYGEAIRLKPDPRNYASRAHAFKAKGDHDNAIADYTEAIRIGPAGSFAVKRAYQERGDLRLAKNDYEGAIDDYTRAEAFRERRQVWTSLGDFQKVIDDLETAIAQSPNVLSDYDELARLFATCPKPELRDRRRAIECAEKACELTRWRDALQLNTLAAVNAELGDFEEAVKWERKAVENAKDEYMKLLCRQSLQAYERGEVYQPRTKKP